MGKAGGGFGITPTATANGVVAGMSRDPRHVMFEYVVQASAWLFPGISTTRPPEGGTTYSPLSRKK